MNEQAARAELTRLKAKRREIADADIRAALDVRIKALEEGIAAAPPEPVAPVAEVPKKVSTSKDREEADKLIALARLERNRGNKAKATDLMKQAADLAPDAAAVLESLGDDLAERKQWKAAKEAYAQAHAAEPKNVGIERKLAQAALRGAGVGSIEDQLRAGLSESTFLNESDAIAGRTAAIVFSAFLPGLGHIVMGRTATGVGILGAWAVLGIWLTVQRKDIAGLIAMATGGGHGTPNLLVLVPLFGMVVLWLGALNSLTDKRKTVRSKIDRPAPPVDMPFE